jgi:hypothetical protein
MTAKDRGETRWPALHVPGSHDLIKEAVRTPTCTLEIWVATAHNLREADIDIPLEVRAALAALHPTKK